MKKIHAIHKEDSVMVALAPLTTGEAITVNGRTLIVKQDIPQGHKLAVIDMKQNENVIKYGYPIGHAKQDILAGEWVHTHNVQTNLEGTESYQYQAGKARPASAGRTLYSFQGYRRSNGEVGIRNEIWIINTVGCINKTAELLAKTANQLLATENIDGFQHFAHPYGCSQLGDDLKHTQTILSNLVHHPNAGGVLVLGLGCENNYVELFKQVLGNYDDRRVKFLVSQEVEDELEAGLALLGELAAYAANCEREPVPFSKLRIGLKCGGSDGFSGITANPLVGAFSDLCISQGATAIMTEVPEMFGAETILMERSADEEVFAKLVNLINDCKEYFIKHDQVVYENPSPGNKAGGITTLEEKSLGCVQKSGFAQVVDVLPYGGRVSKPGLNLVQGPGNDLISVTNLAAAGAHLVLFTTGRGTPFGGPVPTVKISTNSALAEKKERWIDFNAGQLLEGKEMSELTRELFDYIVKVASGEQRTKNEIYGFKEIAIFKDGVIL
ncbi:UxaA family hydrolase [Brevibacillus migulae]|uniref:UxaA family hydrolase n=1 Tax=Brevibacillus migulae TaxID=1644114 RepID=UPI00106EE842|nr:altronate dehydratase family protein [Brevibacillus migulae]